MNNMLHWWLIIYLFLFFVDGNKGFGGAYGIDDRPKDKSAVGFDYKASVEKHSSQTGLEERLFWEKKNNSFFL